MTIQGGSPSAAGFTNVYVNCSHTGDNWRAQFLDRGRWSFARGFWGTLLGRVHTAVWIHEDVPDHVFWGAPSICRCLRPHRAYPAQPQQVPLGNFVIRRVLWGRGVPPPRAHYWWKRIMRGQV